MHHYASTGTVEVTEKFISEDRKDFLVKVRLVNEPSVAFTIDVGPQNVWSLIRENEKYFVLVEYKKSIELNGKTTKLLQIEYL